MGYRARQAQAQQIRAQLQKARKAAGKYVSHLQVTSEIYSKMFPVPKSVAEKVVDAIRVIADIGIAIASCFPGVGQVLGGVYYGVKAVVAIANENVLGFFSNLASAIPGVGAAIGGTTAKAMNIAGRAIQAGIGIGKGIVNKDWGQVVGGLASAAGSIGSVGGAVGKVANQVSEGLQIVKGAGNTVEGIVRGDVSKVMNGLAGTAGGIGAMAAPGSTLGKVMDYTRKTVILADGLRRGDFAGIAGAASSLAGSAVTDLAKDNPQICKLVNNPVVKDVAKYAKDAAPLISALASGNASQILGAVGDSLGKLPLTGDVKQVFETVGDGIKFADALRTGRYGSALSRLSGSLNGFQAGPVVEEMGKAVGQISSFVNAMGTGDPGAVAAALGGMAGKEGFLGSIGGGALTKAFAGASELAGKVLDSSEFKTAMDVTKAGFGFFSAIADGRLDRGLSAVAGAHPSVKQALSTLSPVISSAQPFFKALGDGRFFEALGQMTAIPALKGISEKLTILQPLAALTNGQAPRALEQFQEYLGQLRLNRAQIREFEGLEASVRELQAKFDQDRLAMAQHLLSQATYREPQVSLLAA